MALGLVGGFESDFEALVPKMNQYLLCTIHDIYIGMNDGWRAGLTELCIVVKCRPYTVYI